MANIACGPLKISIPAKTLNYQSLRFTVSIADGKLTYSGPSPRHTMRIDISGRPCSLQSSTSPFTTGPTFSGVPE